LNCLVKITEYNNSDVLLTSKKIAVVGEVNEKILTKMIGRKVLNVVHESEGRVSFTLESGRVEVEYEAINNVMFGSYPEDEEKLEEIREKLQLDDLAEALHYVMLTRGEFK